MRKQTMTHAYTQPYNDEAEKAVLGALILESESYFEVDRILLPEMFYRDIHQTIYVTLTRMHREAVPVDMLTLTEELKRHDNLDDNLTPLYIAELAGMLGSSLHIVQHALYIKQEFIKREVLHISNETARDILSGKDIADILDDTLIRLNSSKKEQ